ncbi:MAG TPA: DUF433 domain-containing protein [Acidimicrobiales bacterium]|nr:DUF433 domain-containing protein [Acidimicrobiales bacterium]
MVQLSDMVDHRPRVLAEIAAYRWANIAAAAAAVLAARFRGTRIPVSVVLDCLAAAMTEEEIDEQYPSLPEGSVRAALAYAAVLAREELHPLDSAPR